MQEQHQLHTEKIAQARAYMAQEGIDCWLIRDRGVGDRSVALLFGTPTRSDALYLITADRVIAIASPEDAPTVRDAGLFDETVVYEGTSGAAAAAAIVERLDPARIALNRSRDNNLSDGMAMGAYRQLIAALGATYRERTVSSEGFIQGLRSIKSEQEVAYIRRAIAITLEIYDEVFAALRPGMSEIEIGELFIAGMKSRGVINGITRELTPPIVMKHKIAHRAPGEGILERGDYLIMDFSVDYMGYCSDIARTAYVLKEGETHASEAMERAFRTVRAATDRAVEALRPGAIGKDVDHAARQYVLDHGYPNIFHAVGHQVGRDVHDGGTILGPEKKNYRKESLGTIEVGMVFAIEPTILYEEGPAIISEDNYLVTATGVELLGEPQRELVLVR